MDVVTLAAAKADAVKKFAPALFRSHAAQVAVTDNCFAAASNTVQSTSGTGRTTHTVGIDCTDLRLVFNNAYNIGAGFPYNDADGTSTLTVGANIDIGGTGTQYRVTFGGRTQATIDPGGQIISDPLPLEVTAGQILHVKTYINATAWYPNRRLTVFSGMGGWTATTDLTAPGSAAIGDTANVWVYAPSAILGTPTASAGKSVLIVGDSIAQGYGDKAQDYGGASYSYEVAGGGGFIGRALRGKLGSVRIAVSGDALAQALLPAGHYRRAAFARFCTHAVDEYGRNDVSSNGTLAALQANKLASAVLWTRRGLKVIVTTITPRTTSSDLWATTGGQTLHVSETLRVSFNTWLRAGAPIDPTTKAAVAIGTAGALLTGTTGHPFTALWEITDLLETARNSGIWKGAERVVTDAAMSTGTPTTLTSATANFTAADVGKNILVSGAGTAGAVLQYAIIKTITNSTTVVVDLAQAATTVTNATLSIGVCTDDGVHPNQYGARLAAPGCDLTKVT